MVREAALALSAALVATSTIAAPWPVMSPLTLGPWEATGTTAELARRGSTCMAGTLRSGFTTAPVILSADIEGGRVIANNAYEIAGTLGQPLRSRSTVTYEAKDGRFRITFTDVEEYIERLGWGAVRVRKGPHDAPRQVAALTAQANEIATCVQAPAENW